MTDWAHPIPNRHHYPYSEPQAAWAIAERLEQIAESLEALIVRIEEVMVVGGDRGTETALRIYAITRPE